MFFSTRVRVLLTLLSILKLNAGDRLTLSEGGYARVLGPQPTPIGSFTLSAWVNVTKFPEGIAPILTYFNNDINSQLAFFLREDGVGVLWGGPTFKDGDTANAARRPRLLWSELKDSQNTANRLKREAIDYSGGLGDIENILHKRLGKATDAWVPINFVDVGDMGVADLMVSGSERHSEGIDRSSRARAYSDWTNVPYELHMAESGVDEDYEDTRQVAESQIITQPSGDSDDFVYFNWNNPTGAQRQVPLGSNNWSPVWEPTKKSAELPEIQSNLHQNVYKGPTAQASNLDETTDVRRPPPTITRAQTIDISNSWNPVNKNYESPPPRPLKTKLLPNKLERPIWPSRSSLPPQILPVQVISTESPNDQENNIKYKTRVVQPTISSREFSAAPKSSTTDATTTKPPTTTTMPFPTSPISTPPTIIVTKKSTTPQRSSLPPRRNIIPTLYRYTIDRSKKTAAITTPKVEAVTKPTQPPKSRARVPLWKLIKKPGKSEEPLPEYRDEILSASASENKKQIYNFPLYEKPIPIEPTEQNSAVPAFNKQLFIEPTLPPIRIPESYDNLQTSASNTRNVYRSRPVHSPSRRTLTTTSATPITTTELPKTTTTTRRALYKPTPITHKVPNYQSSKIEESNPDIKLTSWNKNYKATESKQSFKNTLKHNSHANEFEKTMQDPELIREGNRAVVYAVPITNEKEFYDMYKKYQDQSSKTTEVKLNLHDLYNDMRTGNAISKFPDYDLKINKIKEISHSTNLNKQNPVSNVIAEAEVDTAKILKESNRIEAVTPSRSDIPIDVEEIQQPETLENSQSKDEGSELNDSDSYYVYDDENPNNEEQYYEYEVSNENQPKLDLPEVQSETKPEIPMQNIVTLKPENDMKIKEIHADLYKPDVLATTNAEKIQPSYFQEPVKLYHEQLPPQYEKPVKQYDFSIQSQGMLHPVNADSQHYSNGNNLPEAINSFQSKDIIPQDKPPIINSSNGGGETQMWTATNTDLQIPILPQHLPTNPFKKLGIQSSHGSQGKPQFTEQKPFEDVHFPPTLPQSLPNILQPQINPELNSQLSEVEFDPSEEEANLDIHFEKAPYIFRENGWYHLAYTWNALTKMLRIYVNGEKVADISNVMADKPHMNEGGIFLLGKTLLPDLSDFDTSSQFEGEMSDVNLWTTELDPTSVDSLFQCQLEPSSPQSLDWETTQMNLYDDAFMVPSLPFCGLVS